MAEFSKIAHDFSRMCNYYGYPPCQGCPMAAMGIHGINLNTCRARLLDNPEKYEMIIMQWAKEHPELNYPTWGEWLLKQGVVCAGTETRNGFTYQVVSEKFFTQIDADIAKKLGLKTK